MTSKRIILGDNLYTSSMLALDPKTGKIKWHYQFSPNDPFDYDAIGEPVLATLKVGVAIVIKDRQLDQGEVEFVARRPDHICELVEAVAEGRKRLLGHSHSGSGNVDVDLFDEVGFELVGLNSSL